MKTKIITFIAASLLIGGCSSKLDIEPETQAQTEVETQVESNTTVENDIVLDQNISQLESNTSLVMESFEDDTNTSLAETNTTTSVIIEEPEEILELKQSADTNRTFTKFEKTFVNHTAYNHYKRAIEYMYQADHTNAYSEAMSAKAIYENFETNEDINLPYIPGYIRENAATPKRIYYKIIEPHNYELKRLITKIKLLNPPIALVTYIQTSTYVDITVQNVGDTPLDNFLVEINYEKVKNFEKIIPNQVVTYRYNSSTKIDSLSFTEEYGFAPEPIEFIEE